MSAHNSKLRLSVQARRDVSDINLYTLNNWGDFRAQEYMLALSKAFQVILDNPDIGSIRPHRRDDVRIWPVGKHVVLYRITGQLIRILRVVHQNQDQEALIADL